MFHEKGFRDLGSGFNKMTDIQIQSTITVMEKLLNKCQLIIVSIFGNALIVKII